MTTIVRREARRFTIETNGTVAGHAWFHDEDGRRTFTHTEIDDVFSGQGLGGALVLAALDSTRDEGLRIVPQCPYVQHWLTTHHTFDDLVDQPPA